MQKITKLLLSLALVISIAIPCFNWQVNAAIETTPFTGYTCAEDVEYVKTGQYIHNWGARGEEATFLSTYAINFYTGSNTYDNFINISGGTTQANASQSSLYSTLQTFMASKHTYLNSYNATRDWYGYTDCVLSDSSKLSSFYSGKMVNSTWDSGVTYNREHTWPNSKGLAGSDENDIMMLRPTVTTENGSRSNKAYGESSGFFNTDKNVHGDCARIFLYVYVRWGNTSFAWGSSGVMESLSILLKWMEEDPVDTWEMGRNDAVQAITGTRNVFVDYPELAWQLFGQTAPTDYITPSGNAINGNVGDDNGGENEGGNEGGNETQTELVQATSINAETDYYVQMDQTYAGKTVYLTSGMAATYYLATTESVESAVTVKVEETAGGYYLYYLNGTNKTYINVEKSSDGAHVNAILASAPATVYTWDETLNTLVTAVDDLSYALGTRSDKTYTTLGPIDVSYNDPFIVKFMQANETNEGGNESGGNQGGNESGGNQGGNEGGEDNPGVEPDDPTVKPENPPVSSENSSSSSIVCNNHTYGEWVVTTQPTTKEPGEKTQTCTKCGAKNKMAIPAINTVVTGCNGSISSFSFGLIALLGACVITFKKKKQ